MQNTKDVFRSFLVRNAEYDGKLELPVIKTSAQIPTKVITFSKAMSKSCNDFDCWVIFYEHDKNFERLWNDPKAYIEKLKKFMKDVLGYTKSDSRAFHKNVVESITNKTPSKTVNTPYGVRHTYNTELVGKNGGRVKANVVVVIQKDNRRITYKIITVYPDKKGR